MTSSTKQPEEWEKRIKEDYINAHRHDWTMRQEADYFISLLLSERKRVVEGVKEKKDQLRAMSKTDPKAIAQTEGAIVAYDNVIRLIEGR